MKLKPLKLPKFKNQQEKDEFRAECISLDIMAIVKTTMYAKNMSKSDLAKKLKVSKSYVSQLCTADKVLNLLTIAKLQRILKIKIFG